MELDVSDELDSLDDRMEELRMIKENSIANSIFIPEDVVFDVIVTECSDFEEESFH